MNTIIIATDFSEASQNATNYGVWLAKEVGASVLLTHIYQVPVSTNDMPVMALPIKEIKDSTDIGLEKLQTNLLKTNQGLTIETEGRLGLVSDEINDLCKERKALAVVMGSNNSSGIERMLFGSTTSAVVRNAKCPVIAVPPAYKKLSVERIVLASDLQNIPGIPYENIAAVVQMFKAQLHVVHINQDEEKNPALLLEKLQSLSPTYKQIRNESVNEGINEYVRAIDADLLLMFPHEHNLMERLFFKLHTEDIIAHASIPVLTIRN